MPKVGNKEFDYSPQGMAAAKKASARTGQPMREKKKKTMGGSGEGKPSLMARYQSQNCIQNAYSLMVELGGTRWV